MSEHKEPKNNTYKVKLESPLIRPGLTIETEVSENYVKETTDKLMNLARQINKNDKNSEHDEKPPLSGPRTVSNG